MAIVADSPTRKPILDPNRKHSIGVSNSENLQTIACLSDDDECIWVSNSEKSVSQAWRFDKRSVIGNELELSLTTCLNERRLKFKLWMFYIFSRRNSDFARIHRQISHSRVSELWNAYRIEPIHLLIRNCDLQICGIQFINHKLRFTDEIALRSIWEVNFSSTELLRALQTSPNRSVLVVFDF